MTKPPAASPTRDSSPAEAAAYWVVRKDFGDLSESEEREFSEWSADPVHAEAFEKAVDTMQLFDQSGIANLQLEALRRDALKVRPAPLFHAGRIAAAVTGIALVAAALYAGLHQASVRPAPSAATVQSVNKVPRPVELVRYESGVGQQRTIRLNDGSKVILNTRSEIEVAATQDRRFVRLTKGQALFDVVHDPQRPFSVAAGDRLVTDLGTIFEVRLEPGRLLIAVANGSVRVERSALDTARPALGAEALAMLAPGQAFIEAEGAPPRVAKINIAKELRWRQGFVEFDNEPLENAVAEINRYTNHPIRLSNDGVSQLRVSGVFRTADPKHFAATVSELLPVKLRRTNHGDIELSLASKTDH